MRITQNIAQFAAQIERKHSKRLRRSSYRAATKTAYSASQALKREVRSKFKGRKAFLAKQVQYRRYEMRIGGAQVLIAPIGKEREYIPELAVHVKGGKRPDKASEAFLGDQWAPTRWLKKSERKKTITAIVNDIKRFGTANRRGRGQTYFLMTIRSSGKKAIFTRRNGQWVPLLVLTDDAKYRKSFRFFDLTARHAQKYYPQHFSKIFYSRG